jgi:hypothetical protein
MMGFPAPREAPAQLYVNGQYFGFYTIVEHEDETFLQRNFGQSGGYLYEWEFADTYEFQNLGDDPSLCAVPSIENRSGSSRSADVLQSGAVNQPTIQLDVYGRGLHYRSIAIHGSKIVLDLRGD